jgi:hypothetical protein
VTMTTEKDYQRRASVLRPTCFDCVMCI